MGQDTDQDRAVVFDGGLSVRRRTRAVPAADEALIRLRLAGICRTDLELMAGYKGFSGVLGHEFVGDVIAGPAAWIGQRVVGTINVGCGDCDMCRKGIAAHCLHRSALGIMNYDGAFADVFRLVARNLVHVPEGLADEVAVFTEPLAAACQMVHLAHVRPTDRVVVVGAGKLGLLCAQVLRLTGAEVMVIVRHNRPAQLLNDWGIPAMARDDVPDGQADVVVDCTGNAAGFAEALDLVRPRGVVALKSTYAGLPQVDLTRVVVDEVRVVGSRCGPFDAALRLLASDAVRVRELIAARYTLDDAVQAFDHAAQPGMLKVLLEP